MEMNEAIELEPFSGTIRPIQRLIVECPDELKHELLIQRLKGSFFF
jgi:hypothetical protein